jgi:hypothetical protein
MIRKMHEVGYELDVQRIWREQALPESFEKVIVDCCQLAQEEIITGASRNNVINVTEWCKRKACWDQVASLPYKLPDPFIQQLKEKDEEKAEVRDARREQKGISHAETYIAVVNAGGAYWAKVRKWAEGSSEVGPSDLLLLEVAAAMPKKLPTEKQSGRLMEIRALYEESLST